VLPLVWRYLCGPGAAAPVRLAAGEALVLMMRHGKRQAQRTEIYCRIVRELARGRACHARMAYVDMCHHAAKVFSTRFLKVWVCLGSRV
jgi:hypothetical protein